MRVRVRARARMLKPVYRLKHTVAADAVIVVDESM